MKVYGLTPEGLLPSKALGQVEEKASTAAAREAQGVRVVAESAAERVGDLAAPVAKASLTADHELAAGSPDIREALQSALDGAKHGSDADYWGFLRRLGTKITVAPGVYRVSARADGYPSVVVPRGVALDFSGATLVFEYPKTATTQWAGILAHSQAVLTVGKMRTVGAAPDGKDVYDGIRFYQGDNGNHATGDGGVVSNFQGAGFRLLGTYVTRIRGIRVEFCSHGVVHGHSSGLVNDGQGPYTVPAGSGEAVGAVRRPTDLWLQDMIFDSTRGDVIVVGAVGSAEQPNVLDWSKQSITGGNLYLNHVLIEGTPARAVWARALSQVVLTDVHMEEVGAPQGAMIDTDVVYGNVVVGPMRINITGSRQSQNLAKQPAYATPAGIFQVGGFQSFSCTDMYIRNDLGDLYFSGSEPWEGAWGEVMIARVTVDRGSSGVLIESDLWGRNPVVMDFSEDVGRLSDRLTTLESAEAETTWPTGDITDHVRAQLAALNGKPGVVTIPEGVHYLGGGSEPQGALFTLASGQRIEGAGHDRATNGRTVLWVDDATAQSFHLVRSEGTTGIGVSGLTFENRCSGTIDMGRDPVYLRECSDFELSYNTSCPNNVGFQFDLNIKANAGTASGSWGRKGWVHECVFHSLTEFHSTHDMLVEFCEWNIDRSQVRPNWLKGATQTAFKFSGNWSTMTGARMRDCTVSVTGTGEKFEVFEIVRAPGAVIERLEFRGNRPEIPSNIRMSTPKLGEMGVIEGQMEVVFRDCEFGNSSLFLDENVVLRAKNSRWRNTEPAGAGNFLWDGYNPAAKQAAKVFPNEIHLEGCNFHGGGRVLAATGGGAGLYHFDGCSFEYDNRVYNQAISVTGASKRLILSGCRLRIVDASNGALTVAYLRDIGRSDLNDIVVTTDPGVTSLTAPIWVGGAGTTNVSRPMLLQGGTKLVTKESTYTGTVTGE